MFGLRTRRTTPAIWAALLIASTVAWVLTIRAATGMAAGPGTMVPDVAGFLVLWTLMMAAMMFPSIAPTVSLYLVTLRNRAKGWVQAMRCVGLVAGYLVSWVLFGVLAFVIATAGGKLATLAPTAALWVGAALLAVAGAYQLTPLKDQCLRRCRSPLGFLLHFGRYSGRLRDLRVGFYHGGFCVGCCWGLMVVLIVVGMMNLAWMAGLAAMIFVEKNWRHGKAIGIAFGLALIAFACFVPWHPGLVPGMHMTQGM